MFHAPPLGRWSALAVCLLLLWAGRALALGTPAGTTINNTASVSYSLASDPTPLTDMVTHSFDVLEVIDVVATWQDTANVPVNSPHANAALTFQVTNTGNGAENFQLSTNYILGGDDFDPTPAVSDIWLESNSTVGLQTSGATPDTVYPGGGVLLNADQAMTVYIVSDIPGGLADTQTGYARLTAESMTPGAAGAAAGTDLGGNAVVGGTNADGDDQGVYEVSAPTVTLSKTIAQISDPYGGNQPYTSAQITYRIQVDVSGSGSAQALVITDPIPADTTYVAGSLLLDAAPQTDADDAPADNSDFNITAPNTVTVDLGDTVAPATHIIEFSVTIN